MSQSKPVRRASSRWIYESYRGFCNWLYGPGAKLYGVISQCVSLGQWEKWRRIPLNYLNGGRVLELGFGTGDLQGPLRNQVEQVVGLELSPQMVEITRTKGVTKQWATTLMRANGCDIPLAKASVDAIVSTFPEQYIATVACLSECRRILKPQPTSKMIILGRWVELNVPGLKWLTPVFYRPLDQVEVEEFKQAAETSGFEMKIDVLVMGWATHHVIILS
jgi:ubiquinone/menaquinone biosynthesis C-methylase UbiE